MAEIKDHYVAQTYLKWFCNPQKKLWTYNKEWLDIQERSTRSVCKEAGGSDNPFLSKERAIEDYLKVVENKWNESIKLFTSSGGNVDFQAYLNAKYIISGYIAYLRFSTPAAVRVQQKSLEAQQKTALKILNNMGKIPKPPKGYEFLMEDIEKNIKVEVDGKFPKAIAAGVLKECADKIYRSAWMRVENHGNVPLITSDNPLCFWYNEPNPLPITYLPLTPKLGILIKPFLDEVAESEYDHSQDESSIAKPEFIQLLNEQVIKHAEKIVISDEKSEELLEQVKLYKDWEYDCLINKVPSGTGEYVFSTLKAVKKNS